MLRRRRLASGTAGVLVACAIGWPSTSSAAVITVTSAGDDSSADGAVTLREAISSIDAGAPANADVVAIGAYGTDDAIHFDIPGPPPTISLSSPLPALTVPLTLDASTQPGASGTPSIGVSVIGDPVVARAAATVVGLSAASMLLDAGSENSRVRADVLGELQVTSSGDVIGGSTPGDRDILGGVSLVGHDNVVEGSYIGVGADGKTPTGQGGGVSIIGSHNTIGGSQPGQGNVISGASGVHIGDGRSLTSATTVAGNLIGTDATGTVAVPNMGDGVSIFSPGSDNTVGGVSAASRNVISGNKGDGVDVSAAGYTRDGHFVSQHTVIAENFIGTDITGLKPIGNGQHGIDVYIADQTRVIDDVVAANHDIGILVDPAYARDTQILGTSVGVGSDLRAPLGNGRNGIQASLGSSIIGASSSALPVVANNGGYGIASDGSVGDVNVYANASGPFELPGPNQGFYATLDTSGTRATIVLTPQPDNAWAGATVTAQAGLDRACGGTFLPLAGAKTSGVADPAGNLTLTLPIDPPVRSPDGLLILLTPRGRTVLAPPGCVGPAIGTPPSGGLGALPAPGGRSGATATAVLKRARVAGTKIAVTVACTGTPGATCRVKLALGATEAVRPARRHAKPRTRQVALGSAAVPLATGQVRVVHVSLNAAGRRLLRRRHTVKATLTLTQDGARRATRTVAFHTRARRRKP